MSASLADNPLFNRLAKKMTTTRFKFARMYLPIVFVLAICGFSSLWLLATPYFHNVSPAPENPENMDVLHDVVARKQIVIRTTPTNRAGLGSVVAQLRSSAAIATMLGATLSTFGVVSTHNTQYKVADLLHLNQLETPLDAGAKVCSLLMSPNYARTTELMNSWCRNVTEGDAQASELQELWSDCDLILDDRPGDVHYDMSKCTWKWVKHVFSNLGLKKRTGGIGLHIRWGDMSVPTYKEAASDPLTPERSTPIDKGAQLLRKMRECGVQDELSVYMEWHNTTILSGLGEPYRIVDNDSVDDLLDLSANRILILDISSWTVLAHQIADGGITIIPDHDGFGINWYDNGVNRVLRWQEILDIPCDELSILGV